MKTIEILAVAPNPEDSTSFYRAVGPLGHLRSLIPSLSVKFYQDVAWTHLSMSDILFLQRPSQLDHVKMARMAKDMRVPVWIDYDDHLQDVSLDNPTFDLFMNEDVQRNLKELIELADVITVTTQALKEFLGEKARVIPNAWPEHLFPMPKNDIPRKKGFFWRGGATHQADLASMSLGFRKSAEKYPDREWSFIGLKPWILIPGFKDQSKMKLFSGFTLIEYFKELKNFNLEALVFPLLDTPFNRCKSNIAWMEATYAGAPTICRNWVDWPGESFAYTYSNPDEFVEGIVKAVEQDWKSNILVRSSRDYILSTLSITHVNKLRKELIQELLDA